MSYNGRLILVWATQFLSFSKMIAWAHSFITVSTRLGRCLVISKAAAKINHSAILTSS